MLMKKVISAFNLFPLLALHHLYIWNFLNQREVGHERKKMERSENGRLRPHFHIFLSHTQLMQHLLLIPRQSSGLLGLLPR